MTDITTAGIPLPGSRSAGPSPTMAQMPVAQPVAQDPVTPEYERPGYWKQRIIESEKRQAEQWNLTMRAAIGTDPGVAAEADKLARKLNQPLLKLQDDPQFLRAVSVMKRMTDDKIASTNPVLYKSFQGLEFARKAWDDYEHLSSYERWGNAFNKGMLVSERGRVASDLAMAGDNLKGEPAKNIADARRRFVEIEQEMAKLGPTEGFFNNAGEFLGQWGAQIPRALMAGAAAGAVTGAIGLVAPPAAPFTAAAGFKAGFTAQLAVDVMRTEGGNAYADMVQAGYDPQRAFWASAGVGMANAVLELAGGAIASRAVRTEIGQMVMRRAVREVASETPEGIVKSYLREYGRGGWWGGAARQWSKAVLAEDATEFTQELNNIIAEELAAKGGEKDLSPEGIASRLWEVVSKTTQGMALLGIPGGLVGGKRAKIAQAMAKDLDEQLREGQAIGAASKLNQRDSEAAAGMVREVLNQGGIREAHVDAGTLRDVLAKVDAEATAAGKLQKSALDILEGIVPGVAEQLQQALEVGGDVSVPLGDFVTRIQAEMPEFSALIGPNVRLDPDSPTLDTADKAQAERQADAADTGTEEQAAFYAALKKVEVEATAKIIETGGAQLAPEQVRTVAKVYAAAIETVAREERIDPAEAVKRYGATFEKGVEGTDPRGQFEAARMAVMFGEQSDVSTSLHELTHWFTEVVERLDRQGSAYGKSQFDVLLARWGMTREQWAALDLKARAPMLEDISYNAEEYFATGEAPSEELRGVFGKLRSFIVGLYRNVRTMLASGYSAQMAKAGKPGMELRPMTTELRGFFDRMLAADSAIEAENALRAGAARLSDAAVKAIGADAETVAEIRALEQRQTDEAKEHLTTEAVRGARFFQAGRRNAEKDTHKKLAQAKAKIRKEVEDSLATNPVQAAFQYFRDGLVDLIDGTREFDPAAKKLDSASLRAFLGLPPVKGGEKAPSLVARIRELGGINPEGYPGDLRGEHRIVGVFRKEGGESYERIAQVLAAEGYGGEVYDGALAESVDSSWLVDAIKDAAQGVTLYPSEFVSDSTRMQAEYEAWAKSRSPDADEDVRARRRQQNEGERLYLRLARRRLVQKDGFSDLDTGAKMFGFESAEEMLNGLANAPLREEAIRAETNRRLEAEEPLANPDNFKRAVEDALHGKTAARLLSTILRAMMKGTRESVAGLEAQAKEAARVALLRTPVGRISVRAFAQAERRASQQRDRALAKGDLDAAREAHQRLLVQHYLTIGAAKVEREVQRALVTIDKRYGKSKDQIIEEKRNYDIVNAGRFILGKFGLFPEQATEAARTYLATLRELDPDGWETLDMRVKLATENAKPWRSVSLDDFRVLMATADGMWSESHRSEQMRIDGQLVAMQPLRDEMEGQAIDLFGGGTEAGLKMGQEVMPLSDWSWGSFEAVVSRLEAWTKKMDGGKLGGPWQRNVYRPLKAAAVAKELEMADRQKWWAEHLAKFENSATRPLTGKEIDLRKFFPASSHAKFENIAQVIGALFHMGTESNFRNFILGHGFGEMVNGQLVTRWGDALQYLANSGDLTKRDFDLVQEAVAYINDNFRDRLFTTTREVWGFYPEAVEAMPFDTPFGKYPGGYFPSKVDKRYSNVVERQQFKGIEQGRDEFMRANHNVSRGVVTSRVKFSVEKRVTDLNLVTEHIDTVLSIIHLQPALSDVARLFSGRNNTMAATLQQTQPYAKRGIILPALARMARDSIVAQTDGRISAIATNLKQMASLFFLGLNPKNAAQQFTGLANAIGELGNGPVWASFWTTWSNPSKAFRGIEGMSDAMRNRWSDAMQLASNDIKQILSPSTLGKARAETAKAAFFMQRYAQKMVDAIVWSAAFEKAKGNGIEDAEAVQQADQVVRLTQGEKTPLDVPVILSGDAVKQLFTQFMDYPNTVLNQNLAAPAGRRWATLTWTLLVPTLASSAIGLMLAFGQIGKGDRDDDYNKRLVKHLIGDQIRGAFGLVPIAGSFIGSMLNNLYGFTNDPGGLRNQPFAGWSVVDLVSRVGGGDAKFSDLLAVVAMGAGLPARPAVNVARYQERVESGREEQGDLVDYLRVLLSGR